MKITRSGKCKPKNAFVEDAVIDLIATISLKGRVEDITSLPRVPDDISEVEIINAISHGKVGAANGSMTVSGVKQPFAAFMEFTSTKATLIRSLTLYSKAST